MIPSVIERYTNRADVYHRYRWPYAGEAVDALISRVGLDKTSTVADIGAGSGMLTRHFVDHAQRVYAIEPNNAMRAVAEAELGGVAGFRSLNGLADATGLAADSIDLIVVGRAIHWFPASAARDEFCRILKPGGWLAIFAVRHADPAIRAALNDVFTTENGYRLEGSKATLKPTSPAYFFGHSDYVEFSIPQVQVEYWPRFLGRLLSLSPAPAPDESLYPRFETAARTVFDRLSVDDLLHIETMTTVHVGCVEPNWPQHGSPETDGA